MENQGKPTLNHMVLYAKGWYKRTKHIWEGYYRAILADNVYTPDFKRHDIAYVMLKTLMDNKEAVLGFRDDYDMYVHEEIRRQMDDLITLYKDNIKGLSPLEIYDMAVILFCHYRFQFSKIANYGERFLPSKDVLPLNLKEGETARDSANRARELFGKGIKPYTKSDKWAKMHFDNIKKYYPLTAWLKENEIEFIKPVF